MRSICAAIDRSKQGRALTKLHSVPSALQLVTAAVVFKNILKPTCMIAVFKDNTRSFWTCNCNLEPSSAQSSRLEMVSSGMQA